MTLTAKMTNHPIFRKRCLSPNNYGDLSRRSILTLCLCLTFNVQAQDPDTTDGPLDADFLDFLADVETATGDGFNRWLESDMAADGTDKEQTHTTTLNEKK